MSDGPRSATDSGIPVQRVYGPDSSDPAPRDDPGQPGEFPFTRGIHRTMYRGRPWTMRQYAGFGTAAETNRRYRYLLESGTTGLSVAFDLPTQMGYDSDHPMAAGEVGRVGVAIDSIEDMRLLFEGIPLEDVSTSMTINSTAAILLALYVGLADEQGVPRARLAGTVQNDILKEYIARGTYIYPAEPSLRLVSDVIAFCSRELPRWNPVSISGYHIREAGSTAPQEVAFTFANGLEYVRRALGSGVALEDFAPRLSFFFAAHSDLLEEVAKFRAARRLWARLMREQFGASDRSARLRFHTQTGGSTLTAQQPLNNVTRTTLQALAAVLGGRSLCTPTDTTRRSRSPPRSPPALPCAPNRSCCARAGWPARSILWGGAISLKRLRIRLSRGRARTWSASPPWAGPRSPSTTCATTSTGRRTAPSSRSSRARR